MEARGKNQVLPCLSIDEMAANLVTAHEKRIPIRPLREQFSGMTLADAYSVQSKLLEHFMRSGRSLAGRKVGLTSLAMQRQLGVDAPDFGFFMADMVYAPEAEILARDFIAPRVEPEFAYVLKDTISGPGVTREEAANAIGEIFPAIEIIDSRIQNWDITLVDTVADNASCGAVVLGDEPLNVSADALLDVECSLWVDDVCAGTGKGEAVMGDPVAPLAWLANILGEQGVALEAGQLVLPGSFVAAEVIGAGTTVTAIFTDLGSLTVRFA